MKQAFHVCALTLAAFVLAPCQALCTDWLLARNEAVSRTKNHCLVTLINDHQYLREADGTVWNVTVPGTPISHYVAQRVEAMCNKAPLSPALSTPDGVEAIIFGAAACKVYLKDKNAYSLSPYAAEPVRDLRTGQAVTDRFTAVLIGAACETR